MYGFCKKGVDKACKQETQSYHVRVFREKNTIYLRYFFDLIDRVYIEFISSKYRVYIEEMSLQVLYWYLFGN